MSKTSKFLAVSALALTAGFFAQPLTAGTVQPGNIILAQSSSGGGGDGTSGTRGTVGATDGSAGSMKSGPSSNKEPASPQDPKDATSNIPAQCASIMDTAMRADCIRRNPAPAQGTGMGR